MLIISISVFLGQHLTRAHLLQNAQQVAEIHILEWTWSFLRHP